MDNEVKPTWKLAWGIYWRMFLIGLGMMLIIWLIIGLVGASCVGWLLPFVPW